MSDLVRSSVLWQPTASSPRATCEVLWNMYLHDPNTAIPKGIRYIPLTYNNADSQTSALRLILTLFPDWEHGNGQIEFVRFTDGITNTVR